MLIATHRCAANAPWALGIHSYVHPGRTRRMRHGLPHARRIGRGMLLLLLPFRAFGHGRTGTLVDRAVSAGTVEAARTTSVYHSRHLAVAGHISPTGIVNLSRHGMRCGSVAGGS